MIFDDSKLLLIARPFLLESRYIAFHAAEKLVEAGRKYPDLNVVFKESFDKDNRSSIHSVRGRG
jgi:3-deoxy-D-manno-octulosonic acid (KDO) 8-phosphate synthase